MATNKIQIDEGSTTNLATNSFTEDAVTKHISRSALNNSSGTEIGTSSNPIQVTVANTGANSTAIKVDGSAVTQPVSGTVAVSSITTSITPGTGAAHLGKAEDAAHSSGDTGVFALAVRQDAATQLAGTDGDYSPLITDASGKLHVNPGTVTVAQSTIANLKATVTVVDAAGDSCMDGANNALNVNVVAGGAGDGAILDGVSSSIKATVLDYTNSNPIAVRLTDTSGDYVSAGAGTQYTEDAAAAADPVGGALILVRKDTLAAVTDADGDNIAARGTNKGELNVKHADTIGVTQSGTWTVQPGNTANTTAWKVDASSVAVPVTDNSGSLTVDAPVGTPVFVRLSDGSSAIATLPVSLGSVPSHAVTNAGTFAVQESGTQVQVDDAAFTPATSKIVMAGFEFDDSSPDSVDEGDGGAARMSANRNVYTQIRDAAGNERGANVNSSNQLAIAGPVTNAGTFVVQENGSALTSLQLIDDIVHSGDAALSKYAVIGAVLDDSSTATVTENQASSLRMSSRRALLVEGVASGTNMNVILAANSGVDIGKLTANQTVDLNKLAGNAISSGVGATGTGTLRVVTANDAGRTLSSKGGSVNSSGDNTLVSAGSNKLKVFAFSLSTTSTTAVTCIFQSGASGTELWRCVLQAPTSVSTGANLAVTPPAYLFATASATLLNLNLSGAITVHYSVSYFDEA